MEVALYRRVTECQPSSAVDAQSVTPRRAELPRLRRIPPRAGAAWRRVSYARFATANVLSAVGAVRVRDLRIAPICPSKGEQQLVQERTDAAVAWMGRERQVVPRFDTKADVAYVTLRAQILSGELQAGKMLNQEALAEGLGLSTTPLREALRRLEAENLVSVHAHRDLVVAPLSQRELSQLVDIRLQLDPHACSLAARHATEEQIAITFELSVAPPTRDALEQVARNRAFHRSIYAASGNELLTQLLDSLWDRTDRYRVLGIRKLQDPRRTLAEHVEIASAFRDRRARHLAALVRKHVQDSHQLLLAFQN
jgi:DNA-binding GntR family transcriptional regulator